MVCCITSFIVFLIWSIVVLDQDVIDYGVICLERRIIVFDILLEIKSDYLLPFKLADTVKYFPVLLVIIRFVAQNYYSN